jgi:hypothetical protein
MINFSYGLQENIVWISSRLGAEIVPGCINFLYRLSEVISGQHKDMRDREKAAAHSRLETSYMYSAGLSLIYLMEAIPLYFNIEVYVFTSITQQKLLKYQLYFS